MAPETQPGKLLDSHGQPIKHSRVKLDFTINIPTLISIITLSAGLATWGVRTYYEMSARTDRNTYDLAVLQDRIRTVETQVTQVRADNSTSVQALRGEIRVDLLEIKGTLKDLMFRGNNNRQLNEWSR
ncbi:hypothetical protein D3C87_1001760 [compost metagenome]